MVQTKKWRSYRLDLPMPDIESFFHSRHTHVMILLESRLHYIHCTPKQQKKIELELEIYIYLS